MEKMKLFVALDNLKLSEINEVVGELDGQVMFKLNDAYTRYGPKIIEDIHRTGAEVFLDLKFFDIPNTMANYMKAVADMGVYMCNLHCLSGKEGMMKAAQVLKDYCQEKGVRKPLLIGVTILTSMNTERLKQDILMDESGCEGNENIMERMVIHLAKLAKEAGLDGVVCSAKEIQMVKEACGADFLTITPGIRPSWACLGDDQKRVMTPQKAIELGADYLVIGRPIVQAAKYNLSRSAAVNRIRQGE